jgi:hypothetical protein
MKWEWLPGKILLIVNTMAPSGMIPYLTSEKQKPLQEKSGELHH